jgi:flagellar hook-length control protein FliK
MNINSLIASLVSPTPSQATSAGSSGASSAPSSTDSGAQFKAQFGQAVAALTTVVDNAQGSAGSAASATAGSGATTAPTATDTLTAALQKKISDLLAAGDSVQSIVQQLAGALANAFAGQFGGNLAQIQTQLQSTFASALSPPGNGPPASTADLASTLAQRFRQVADLAAGVIGETGQSNRLFAGSFSDAVTAAGGQPAPGSTNGTTTADSIASDAAALFASLTASQGDGKTVASTAPAIGTNGDTLLGRILARAAAASSTVTSTSAPAPAPAAAPAPSNGSAASAALVDRAIAAATALLANVSAAPAAPSSLPATPTVATLPADVLAASASRALAAASTTTDATAPATPSTLTPTIAAFVKAFSAALDAASGTASTSSSDKTQDQPDAGTATVTPVTVDSSQAPTIGAFAPVAPSLHVDALAANPTSTPAPHAAPADPNAVIDQVLRGAFLNTTGDLSTVRLKLVPDSLGDVSVKLAINGSSVAAQVVAQTPAAHDALVAGQAQLTRALSDAGLKLTSFSVSLGGGFTSFQQQQQHSGQQPSSSGRRLLLGDVDTSETDDTSLSAIPSFAPPATAATGWGAYNYLV